MIRTYASIASAEDIRSYSIECACSIKELAFAVSAISKAEMYAGSYRRRSPLLFRQEQDDFFSYFPSLPFNDAAADFYGRIHAFLRDRGQLMGVADMQIAAIAMANGLTIVTHDMRGFTPSSKSTQLKIGRSE